MPLRVRLLLIGLAGLAISLLVGGFAFFVVVSGQGTRQLDANARATAAQVGGLVTSGRLPASIPVTAAQLVQVVDVRARVLSASVNADRLTSLLRPAELRRTPLSVEGSRAGLSGPLRVLAVPVRAADGHSTDYVVVAQQTEDLERTLRLLRLSLLLLFPVLLAALGVVAWRVMGAALRPVEALRAGAERISGSSGDARLPVPATRDEIAALATTLNDMLDRLAAGRARQRSFVADAAHELRSPLASMRTQLEVAERVGWTPEQQADLLLDLDRMGSLVEDLLVLARLDAGVRREARVASLSSVVAGLGAGPVVVDVPEGLVVAADPRELERVLVNLLGNASRHARSSVSLSARGLGDEVEIVVEDDGPGIPPEDRERVFERFTRLDDARARDAGGAGLGLAIVRGLVGQSGGTVSLGGSGLGGLRVVVRLKSGVGQAAGGVGPGAAGVSGASADPATRRVRTQETLSGPRKFPGSGDTMGT